MGDIPLTPGAPGVIATAAVFAIIILALCIVGGWQGIKMVGKADRQKPQDSGKTAANVVIGVAIIVLCVGGAILTVVVSVLTYFFNIADTSGPGGTKPPTKSLHQLDTRGQIPLPKTATVTVTRI